MALVLKAIKSEDPTVNGRAVALFLDSGEPLPNQIAITTAFDTESGQSHVTVTFVVDGKEVRFE